MGDKLRGADDREKLKDLATRSYKAQAVWFLNAYWDTIGEPNAEKIWTYVEKIVKFDLQKGAEGNEVDELQMHKFLENLQETLTVRDMRDLLRSKGAIGDTFKMIALIHYLVYRYEVDFHELVNAPQGDNKEELEQAQRMLDEVSKALKIADSKAQAAKAALQKAKSEEADAKAKESDAKAKEADAKSKEAAAKAKEAEAKASAEKARAAEQDAKTKEQESKSKEQEAKAAQVELEAALAELKAQEDAFNNRTDDLKRKSEEGTVVAQNRAKNELAQHLSSDPLPLRKAKITQEAAVKKADKTTKAAAEARVASEAAAVEATKTRKASEEAAKQASSARASAEEASRQATAARTSAEESARRAEAARQAADEAHRQAEAALDETRKRVEEAEAYLAEVKSRPGKSHGAIWWIERQLFEKKKFIPVSKGGISK